MENASKALIIAGAILLSIAIIGIGMYVYQMAAGVVNQANMSGAEVTSYNAEFIKYEGTQTGTSIKTLCDTVRQHNSYQEDNSKKVQITVGGTDLVGDAVSNDADLSNTTAAEIARTKNTVNAGGRYRVTFGYTTSGLIKHINASLVR